MSFTFDDEEVEDADAGSIEKTKRFIEIIVIKIFLKDIACCLLVYPQTATFAQVFIK